MTEKATYRPNEKYTRLLKKADPALKPDSDTYPYAVVLFAAGNVGTDAKAIARECGYPVAFARKIRAGFSKAGIFRGEKIHHSGWFDKKTGTIAFWIDVACGQGLMRRTSAAKKEPTP